MFQSSLCITALLLGLAPSLPLALRAIKGAKNEGEHSRQLLLAQSIVLFFAIVGLAASLLGTLINA